MEDQNQPPAHEQPPVNEPVNEPQEKPNKILAELEKYKKMAKELESKMKNSEIEKAKKDQEWQRVAEIKEQEAREAQEKLDKFKNGFINDKKLTSIREEAIKAGIRKESMDDLRLIDFPEISLDPTDEGNFVVSGADKAVQRLKALRPHWFSSPTPTVNTTTPSVNGASKISLEDLRTAELEAKKTGDYKKVTELYLAYKKAK